MASSSIVPLSSETSRIHRDDISAPYIDSIHYRSVTGSVNWGKTVVRQGGGHLDYAGPAALLQREPRGVAGMPRVLLIGWDGADWRVLGALLESRAPPHLPTLLGRRLGGGL